MPSRMVSPVTERLVNGRAAVPTFPPKVTLAVPTVMLRLSVPAWPRIDPLKVTSLLVVDSTALSYRAMLPV